MFALLFFGVVTAAVYATRSELTVTTVGRAGTAQSLADADQTNGDKFQNDGRTFLILNNLTGATTATITVLTGSTYGGFAVGNQAITLNPAATKIVGPFNKAIFDQTSTDAGYVYLDYSAATSVTLMVIH